MTVPPVSPATRAVRAAIFAVLAVALSAAGHSHVAGHGLSFSTLLLAFSGTATLTWAFADRERGAAALVGGLAGMQLLLHLWFGIAPVAGGGGEHASHGAPGSDSMVNSPAMAAAHCAAALFCGLWLWFGERALFTLLGMLYARVVVPLLLIVLDPVGAGAEPGRAIDLPIPKPSGLLLRHVLARRGPPASVIPV